jgi:hypothetical protein
MLITTRNVDSYVLTTVNLCYAIRPREASPDSRKNVPVTLLALGSIRFRPNRRLGPFTVRGHAFLGARPLIIGAYYGLTRDRHASGYVKGRVIPLRRPYSYAVTLSGFGLPRFHFHDVHRGHI